jgi:hypothetical protein
MQDHYSPDRPPPVLRNPVQDLLNHLAVSIACYQRTPWTSNPWILDVPHLVLQDYHETLAIFSIRAVSLATRAIRYKSYSLEKTARSFYAVALTSHREAVSRALDDDRQSWDPKNLLALLTTSMLLFEFEMMFPSAPFSWILHAKGAAHILEKLGPQRCQETPLRRIFLVLRHIMVRFNFVYYHDFINVTRPTYH